MTIHTAHSREAASRQAEGLPGAAGISASMRQILDAFDHIPQLRDRMGALLANSSSPYAFLRRLLKIDHSSCSPFEQMIRKERHLRVLRYKAPKERDPDGFLLFTRPEDPVHPVVDNSEGVCAFIGAMWKADRMLAHATEHLRARGVAFEDAKMSGEKAVRIRAEGCAPINRLAQRLAQSGITLLYSPATNHRVDAVASFTPATGVLSLSNEEILHCDDSERLFTPTLRHELSHVDDMLEDRPGAISPHLVTIDGRESGLASTYYFFCSASELNGFRETVKGSKELLGHPDLSADEHTLASVFLASHARRGAWIASRFHKLATDCLEQLRQKDAYLDESAFEISAGELAVQFSPTFRLGDNEDSPSGPVAAAIRMFDEFGYSYKVTLPGPYREPAGQDDRKDALRHNLSVLTEQMKLLEDESLKARLFFKSIRTKDAKKEAKVGSIPPAIPVFQG